MNAPEATFFVATGGRNAWSGKLPEPNEQETDGPFRTLARARDAVREMKEKEGLTGPVTVMVRAGKYYLADTLVLGYPDSGSRDCPVTYTAYPGEKPVLSGGMKLTGWKPYKGKIRQCRLAKARGGKWKFRQLFLNGERQIRARWPKFDPDDPLYGGWAFMEGPADEGTVPAFRFEGGCAVMERSLEGGRATAFKYKRRTFPLFIGSLVNTELILIFPLSIWFVSVHICRQWFIVRV